MLRKGRGWVGGREVEGWGCGGVEVAQECLCGDGERRRAGMRPTIPTVSEPSQGRFPSYLFSPRPPSIVGPVRDSTAALEKWGKQNQTTTKKTLIYGAIRGSSICDSLPACVWSEGRRERCANNGLIWKGACERSASASLEVGVAQRLG